jgi:hypothetical protein
VSHANEGQIYRYESGVLNLSSDSGLKLYLQDFGPANLCDDVLSSFLIRSKTLCGFIAFADRDEASSWNMPEEYLLSGARKRRRPITLPEEIRSQDERKFITVEQTVLAVTSDDDSSFEL